MENRSNILAKQKDDIFVIVPARNAHAIIIDAFRRTGNMHHW